MAVQMIAVTAAAVLVSNLAVACHHCNLYKGPNLTGIDPSTRKVVRIFIRAA